MSKIAFVFSGQGAQYPGMGRSLSEISPAVKALYTAAESIRPGISALSFDGTVDELKQTINTQPTLYLVDLGAALALKEAGITPDVVGGFSLGELPALAFAGAYTAEEGFSLVLKRAQFMAQASDEMPDTPAMAAVMRMSPEDIEAVCAKLENVYPANYNAPEQTVISGTVSGVAAFKNYCAENGIAARLVDLPVSGAFHTPFMAEASEKFGAVLADFAFRSVNIPAYANLTGGEYPNDPAEYSKILAAQIRNPVRWVKEVSAMIDAGVDTFVECGAGKTLSGLIKKIDKTVKIYNVENEETLVAAIAGIRG